MCVELKAGWRNNLVPCEKAEVTDNKKQTARSGTRV
jgi:hypothetical protein